MSENVVRSNAFEYEIVDLVAAIAYIYRVNRTDSMVHFLGSERVAYFCRHDPMAGNANYRLCQQRKGYEKILETN